MLLKLNKFTIFLVFTVLLSLNATVFAAGLPDFTKLVEDNSDAVVNISTTQRVQNTRGFLPPGVDIPENSPYGDLFKHFFGAPGQHPKFREAKSLGSGFVISEDGYILTNHHVVKNADEIIVRLQDRRELKAELIGSDERTDVALLKVDTKGLPVVQFGSSKDLKVGEWVFAIGSPFGFDSSVTAGIVSAKGRSLPNESYVPFIQTDVAINPGNSGGPLFNLDGEVVGINSQIYSRTGGFMGLSFAIPIDVAMNVADQLKKTGHVDRGWLGVRIQDVTRDLAESFGMDKPEGALVAQVVANSPAEKAGIKVGDVIIKFNGEGVINSSSLPPMVGSASLKKKSTVQLIRNNKTKTLSIKLESLPVDKVVSSLPNEPAKPDLVLGMTVSELAKDVRKQLDISSGAVFVKSVEADPALKSGIKEGDIILQVGGTKIKNVKHFKKQVGKVAKGQSIAVLVNRNGNPIFLALKK